MTLLEIYVRQFGSTLTLGNQLVTVDSFSDCGNYADMHTDTANVTGIVSPHHHLVPSLPGAEVWTVIDGGQKIARFAILGHTIQPLRG